MTMFKIAIRATQGFGNASVIMQADDLLAAMDQVRLQFGLSPKQVSRLVGHEIRLDGAMLILSHNRDRFYEEDGEGRHAMSRNGFDRTARVIDDMAR